MKNRIAVLLCLLVFGCGEQPISTQETGGNFSALITHFSGARCDGKVTNGLSVPQNIDVTMVIKNDAGESIETLFFRDREIGSSVTLPLVLETNRSGGIGCRIIVAGVPPVRKTGGQFDKGAIITSIPNMFVQSLIWDQKEQTCSGVLANYRSDSARIVPVVLIYDFLGDKIESHTLGWIRMPGLSLADTFPSTNDFVLSTKNVRAVGCSVDVQPD